MAHKRMTQGERREAIMHAVRRALKDRRVCIPPQALESLKKVLHARRFYDVKVVCGPKEAADESLHLTDDETTHVGGGKIGQKESILKVVYGGKPELGVNYRRKRYTSLNHAECEEHQRLADFDTSKLFVVILERRSWARMGCKTDSEKSKFVILIYVPEQNCSAKANDKPYEHKAKKNKKPMGGG